MANLTDPNSFPTWKTIFLFLPGFVGSMIATYYLSKPATKTEAAGSVLAGTLTSVFCGPYIAHLVAPDNQHALSGIGFGVGLFTILFMPQVITKIREMIDQFSWQQIKEFFTWKKGP